MRTRFAGQAALALAPTFGDPALARQLQEVLLTAEQLPIHKTRIGLPGQRPTVELLVSQPGRTALIGDAPLGPSAHNLLYEPPELIGSLSFDPISAAVRPPAGTLAQIAQSLPAVLHHAGLRPGDLVTANPEGIRRGDFRRAVAFMHHGAGPVDALGQQRARINDDGTLSPVLLYQADPRFMQHMNW